MTTMTTMTKLSIALSSALVMASACGGSFGAQQPGVREELSLGTPQVDRPEIDQVLALRPQLPKPYRLGVFFRANPAKADDATWRWAAEQKQAILELEPALQASGEVSALFAVGDATMVGWDLPAIRVAAARNGADAVLIVSGADEVKQSSNGWALAYLALLPLLAAPGTELDVLFSAHAEMWDVRNEYLYLSAEAESEVVQQRPLAWIDREQATRGAQVEATELLANELGKRFELLHATAQR
jgi:hypothetical protein